VVVAAAAMNQPAARSTWGWLIVLALALGAIVWQAVRPTAPVGRGGHDDHDAAAAPLVASAEANWSAVELLGPDGMTRFERDASGRWLVHGGATQPAGDATPHTHRADPAAAERIASVFAAFARTRIERTLPVDPARLTAYGLDRPEWIVLIHGADARPLATIEVGQLAPDRLSRYARLPSDGRVLMMPNYQIEGLVALTGAASTAPASSSASAAPR
jgi:hypothetical protein